MFYFKHFFYNVSLKKYLPIRCVFLLAPQQRLDLKEFLNSLPCVSEHIPARVIRYVIYILLIRGLQKIFRVYNDLKINNTKLSLRKVLKENKKSLLALSVAISLQVYMKQIVVKEDFPLLFTAFLITDYCQDNYVKKLFIIITRDLFCHPDLKDCNKLNRSDLPFLEAIKSPPHVEKDVAGVKGRTYRNSAYKINRPGKLPVPLSAEFAASLHTLKQVLDKRAIYKELGDVDKEELVRDFCAQLERTIERSPECRGKCVLVHYDNTDDSVNLADVLLEKIQELQPDFEDLLVKKYEERKIKDS